MNKEKARAGLWVTNEMRLTLAFCQFGLCSRKESLWPSPRAASGRRSTDAASRPEDVRSLLCWSVSLCMLPKHRARCRGRGVRTQKTFWVPACVSRCGGLCRDVPEGDSWERAASRDSSVRGPENGCPNRPVRCGPTSPAPCTQTPPHFPCSAPGHRGSFPQTPCLRLPPSPAGC